MTTLIATLLLVIAVNGCHHRPNLEPIPSSQTYCWWTSQYVTQPPVLVAWAFQNAFATVGFSHMRWKRNADSAWAAAGPARLPASPGNVMYAFRVVAFAARDSVRCAWQGMPSADVVRRPIGAESCFHTEVFIYSAAKGSPGTDVSP